MREKGIGTGAIIAIVVGIVVAVVVTTVGVYFIIKERGSQLEVIMTPSTLKVGDSYSGELRVTNREPESMIIHGLTVKIYREGQLLSTENMPTNLLTTTNIPPGQTVTIYSASGTITDPTHVGSVSYSAIGAWKMEVFLETNYGTLMGYATWTVSSQPPAVSVHDIEIKVVEFDPDMPPVADADVKMDGFSGTTNTEGRVKFVSVPEGSYLLRISHPNYKLYSTRVFVPADFPKTAQLVPLY
jgi:hypothetical protein